jgi:hypothetical protein
MDKGPWGMGAYQPRPAGPMGMKNGPPPAAYGGSGPHNYSAPPGPAGFRPSYPPAPGGGFGGPQYGGGPGESVLYDFSAKNLNFVLFTCTWLKCQIETDSFHYDIWMGDMKTSI